MTLSLNPATSPTRSKLTDTLCFLSVQIQWFWLALRSFSNEDRAKFIQFVTGTSRVPLQGFAELQGMNGAQKFQIHRDDRSTDRLPSAHTWYVHKHRDWPPRLIDVRLLG